MHAQANAQMENHGLNIRQKTLDNKTLLLEFKTNSTHMDQLKLHSLCMKISTTTDQVFTSTFLEELLVAMLLKFWDMDLKMDKTTGSVLIHGEQAGENLDSSELLMEIVELMTK